MDSLETRLGRSCRRTEKITKNLEEDFGDMGAREHLVECVDCRTSLGKNPDCRISTLARNFRDGMACAG